MRDTQFINSVKITRRVISAGYNEVEIEIEMERKFEIAAEIILSKI